VHALTGRDQWSRLRIRQAADAVRERAGGVDHDLRAHPDLMAVFQVCRHHAVNEPVRLPGQTNDRRIVQQRRALLGGGLREVDEQPRVVELPIVVDHAAAQPFGPDRGKPGQRLIARQDFRVSKPVLTRQHVVHLQSQTIERRLPPVVVRHDKR